MVQKEAKKLQLTPEMAYSLFEEEKHRMERIYQDLTKLEGTVFELDKTLFAVKELSKTREKEVFVSFGNGVYVGAKVDNKDIHIMTPGNVFMNRSQESVAKELEERKKTLLNNVKQLRQLQAKTDENLGQLYKYLTFIQQKNKQQQNKE